MTGTIIKPIAIAAYILKKENNEYKYLLIRRCSTVLTGTWQMVTGGIDAGETAKQAALREVFEETGLRPSRFYSADTLLSFYDISHDLIMMLPVFVAFIDNDQGVVLSPHEHDAFQWVERHDASKLLDFAEHKRIINHIDEHFVKKAPFEFLRIKQD